MKKQDFLFIYFGFFAVVAWGRQSELSRINPLIIFSVGWLIVWFVKILKIVRNAIAITQSRN